MCPAEIYPPMRYFIGDNDISRKNNTRKGNSFFMGGVSSEIALLKKCFISDMYNKLLMFYTQITVFAIHDLPYGLLALLCQC